MELANIENYYPSMNRVYQFIDDNIGSDLSLAALSSVSGYSPYHFHRIFHSMTGKTPREYVLERRLASAARRLLYDEASITRIALEAGFSSSGSFVRSFKKSMGCPPSAYRKGKARKRPVDMTDAPFKQYVPAPEIDSLFSIQTLPDLRVVGIAAQGLSKSFKSDNIENAFKRLFAWLKKRGLIEENMQVMGITLDTPEVVSFAECRYFACVPADGDIRPEGAVSVRTFPTKGKYIKFSLERNRAGFADAFFETVDYLYGYHMPQKGYMPDNRPFVEFYAQNGPDITMTFCVPVK